MRNRNADYCPVAVRLACRPLFVLAKRVCLRGLLSRVWVCMLSLYIVIVVITGVIIATGSSNGAGDDSMVVLYIFLF